MTEKIARAELDKIIEIINYKKSDCLNSCIEIGSQLHSLKESNIYMYIKTEDGNYYASVYDLIKDYFAFSKSTTDRYIGVYKKFGDVNTNEVKSQYSGYSFSQLCEMLSMNDSLLTKCDSIMTCEDLRELKKKDKGFIETKDFISDPNTSLQVNFTKELYDKVLSFARKRQKHMADYVVEIIEMFFKSMESEVVKA
ncbi:MAG: hypothetical protein IKT33_01325 [Clostridia bacterium]|nr:hypothetical protein [Clostridia bacterium]